MECLEAVDDGYQWLVVKCGLTHQGCDGIPLGAKPRAESGNARVAIAGPKPWARGYCRPSAPSSNFPIAREAAFERSDPRLLTSLTRQLCHALWSPEAHEGAEGQVGERDNVAPHDAAASGRSTSTGLVEPRITLSATLPSASRCNPPRPWVVRAMMS